MTRRRKWLLILALGLCAIVGLGGTWLWYLGKYVHQHCIMSAGLAFRVYSSNHQGRLPFSTNGFGDALLILAREDPSSIHCLCGPGDDGQIFAAALTNNSHLPEVHCSRVYVQGLTGILVAVAITSVLLGGTAFGRSSAWMAQ